MPKQTTGRFETRAELEEEVRARWYQTQSTQSDIARACRVSDATVANILKAKPVSGTTDKEQSHGH